jgi:hypothetical protein
MVKYWDDYKLNLITKYIHIFHLKMKHPLTNIIY